MNAGVNLIGLILEKSLYVSLITIVGPVGIGVLKLKHTVQKLLKKATSKTKSLINRIQMLKLKNKYYEWLTK